jgi:hypothetical protein
MRTLHCAVRAYGFMLEFVDLFELRQGRLKRNALFDS